MYYGARRKREGFRALLSVAVLATGVALSDLASTATIVDETAVEGLWRWVSQASDGQARDEAGRLFEIRRDADGQLRAIIAMSSGGHVREATVSFREGHVCMSTGGGATFSGQLSDDGTLIHGVIEYDGATRSALFKRVDRRSPKASDVLPAYAT